MKHGALDCLGGITKQDHGCQSAQTRLSGIISLGCRREDSFLTFKDLCICAAMIDEGTRIPDPGDSPCPQAVSKYQVHALSQRCFCFSRREVLRGSMPHLKNTPMPLRRSARRRSKCQRPPKRTKSIST